MTNDEAFVDEKRNIILYLINPKELQSKLQKEMK